MLLVIQGLAEAFGVHPPEVVDGTVHEDHWDLLGVAVGKIRIVEDGDLGPRDTPVGAHGGHHHSGVVA